MDMRVRIVFLDKPAHEGEFVCIDSGYVTIRHSQGNLYWFPLHSVDYILQL